MAKPKPWSVADFERIRLHLTLFVRSEVIPLIEDAVCRRILIDAPVKCGKKDMVEYIAMRDFVHNPKRVHAFVSAWHRTADEDQRDELKEHNLTVFSIINKVNVDKFNQWLETSLAEGKELVIHMDECDHGSGSNQILSKIWSNIRMSERITTILYSATPEEVLYSKEIDDIHSDFREGEYVVYRPPEEYCGAERFLREGLVHEAMPFFEEGDRYSLSDQGKEIIANLYRHMETDPSRNILVLRLSGSLSKNKKWMVYFLNHIDDFLELKDWLIVADKSDTTNIKHNRISLEKIQWSDEKYWRRQATGIPMIYVIDQTCSRSTELKCHHRIYAMHDFRSTIQYNTVAQAQQRVIHYIGDRYSCFQPIHVYGSVKTFKLSAGLITIDTYLTYELKKKKITSVEKYKILYSDRRLHPSCSEEGMDERDADRILQEHGCFAEISISTRIEGSVREVRVYEGEWIPMKPEEWDTKWPIYSDKYKLTKKRDPFKAAEDHKIGNKWRGQHRGWKELDYSEGQLYEIISGERKRIDIGSTGGHRIKICYKNDEVGIFVVRCTGTKLIDDIHPIGSMYAKE